MSLQFQTPERRREIAVMGGKAVAADRRSFARDPKYAQEAGRRGGLTRARRAAERKAALETMQ